MQCDHFPIILVAAEKMVAEDYWGAMIEFESILADYPLDPYSLHMAYFLALTIGKPIQNVVFSYYFCEAFDPLLPAHGLIWPSGRKPIQNVVIAYYFGGLSAGPLLPAQCTIAHGYFLALTIGRLFRMSSLLIIFVCVKLA